MTPVFYLLGPLEIRNGTGLPVPLTRRMQRAVLVLLLLRAGSVVTVDELIEAVWDEWQPRSVRANLHSHVSGLRRALAFATPQAGPRPVTAPPGYRLDTSAGECDTEMFEMLVAEGRRSLQLARPGVAVERLDTALRLWRGSALDDVRDHGWAAPHAARWEQCRVTALEYQIEARLMLGQHVDVGLELAATVEQHPLRESLWAQFMVALYRSGRRAEASGAYRRLGSRLHAELGIRPSREMRELHLAIVREDSERVGIPWGREPVLSDGPALLGAGRCP